MENYVCLRQFEQDDDARRWTEIAGAVWKKSEEQIRIQKQERLKLMPETMEAEWNLRAKHDTKSTAITQKYMNAGKNKSTICETTLNAVDQIASKSFHLSRVIQNCHAVDFMQRFFIELVKVFSVLFQILQRQNDPSARRFWFK